MKIRFVLCHRTDDVRGEIRQVILASNLRQRGLDAAVFAISETSNFAKAELDENQTVTYFSANDTTVSVHDTTSLGLLERLVAEDPDFILVKGIDYAVARDIFARFSRSRLGVIVGGVADHPLLHQCAVIYFETKLQLDNFTGDALKLILPKFIRWDDVLEHSGNGIDFDIVNVGNFDEDRKAQELLLPFIFSKRVVLIGGGRKFKDFRSICANRSNVELPGFVSSERLYNYLSRSKLMVHCSTWDGYPRAVAEGLCAGVPVVGLTGVLDGIAPEPLIRTASLERLHSTVFDLLDRPGEIETVGRQASAYMRENASEARIYEVFQKGLEAAIRQA